MSHTDNTHGQMHDPRIDAIKEVVATVEHAQRNELVEEFVGLFRADAIWTTATGKVLIGRDEIADFTRKVLPGAMREISASYEVVHVLFLRPDVAAVKVRQRYLTLDGAPLAVADGGGEGSPLYVMTEEDGRWLLTANQNTGVADH
ncbi:SgcJ/EcaC family oxidoreductase [Streptomyces sp. NBC_01465]|uniref:SgcJ/EcaC family oxidoreductase n=1 Tax=Streptomyces sp. NBC_01465 TaxID=2903878 RepID=UPI002E34EF12|nr:SgcJ/EcaC family oxidoreductase [Streptomyces sp. NBC_01465]